MHSRGLLVFLSVVVLLLSASPALAECDNPMGCLDVAEFTSAMSSFIGYFQVAIAIIVGVFAAVAVVKGVKGIMGGGG